MYKRQIDERSYYACEELLTGAQHIYRACDFKPGGRLFTIQGYQTLVLRNFTKLKESVHTLEKLYARFKSSGLNDLERTLRRFKLGDAYETWLSFVDEALMGRLSASSLSALENDIRFNGFVREQWDFSTLMTGAKLEPTEVVSKNSSTVKRSKIKGLSLIHI